MHNTATHTPGPWRISGCKIGDSLLIEHGDIGTVSPCIGLVYIDEGRLPQQANARLIAAAPEMLEALKGLIGDCSQIGLRGDAYTAAVNVLAKAEGK
jgi:hypothetical protein